MKKIVLFLICLSVPLVSFANYHRIAEEFKYNYSDCIYAKALLISDLIKESDDELEKKTLKTMVKVEFKNIIDLLDLEIDLIEMYLQDYRSRLEDPTLTDKQFRNLVMEINYCKQELRELNSLRQEKENLLQQALNF